MVKENTMKQTEIGLIPEDWVIRKLGELGEVKMCKRIFQNQTSKSGDIPFFKIGTFGKEPDVFITRGVFDDFKNRFSFPEKGEILISAAGTIGRTVIYDGADCYFQDSNIVWINNKQEVMSNKLLKYILEDIKYNTEGGTIQRLYNSILRNTLFICPPIAEQESIATALSDCDAWIESLEQVIKKKRLIKQGTMQELLTPKEDWEVKKLGDCSFITKLAGFEYSLHFNSYKDEGEIIVLRGTNITKNKLDLCDIKTIPRKTSNYLIRSKLFKNDLVFAYVGTIGPIYLVEENDRFHLGPNTAKITVNKELSSKFLYHYFTSSFIENEIIEHTSIGAQPSLSMSKIRSFKLNFPSLSEQIRIAIVLSDMDAEIEALTQKLNKARQLKQGMMQELLTGKVRLI